MPDPDGADFVAPRSALLKMLLAGGLAFVVLAAVVMVFLGQIAASLRTTLADFDPDAIHAIEILLGAPLPAAVREVAYRQGAQFHTVSFALSPGEYLAFIARVRPVIEAGCWILPLKPEGEQVKKSGCGVKTMTISVDKTNPAVWRITIDIR